MKKVKKKQQKALFTNIIFSLIALLALTVSIVFLLFNYSLKSRISEVEEANAKLNDYAKNYIYTQEDVDRITEEIKSEVNESEKKELLSEIKEIMDNGYSAYYLLRNLYPDEVVVLSDNKYSYFPINKDLKLNQCNLDSFVQDEETGEITYVDEDGTVLSKKGIDVSSHNGKIDWAKVKKDGVEFAFIRVGFRGSTEGKITEDSTFKYNIENATKNGIDVGVYFFTQATNEAEAKEEAQYVLDMIEPYKVTYPVAYDIEKLEGRADSLDSEQYTKNTIAFLEMIKNSGYEPMVYGNLHGLFMMENIEQIEDYSKWFAYYIYPLYYPYELKIWQYSSSGKVDGISGNVDLNILL